MHGFRAKIVLRSIADSFCESKWHHHIGKRLTRELKMCRSLTTTRGPDFLEPVARFSARSMQMQIIEALRLGERRKASNLLLEFGFRSHSLRADDFDDILKYCAHSPDPLFVMDIWRLMEEKDVSMNSICFFLMMQALLKGGYLEEAFNMMDFLGESQRLYPVLPLYNSLLSSCMKIRSIVHASKCLELMEKQMAGKNEVTYTELLKLAVLQKNLPAVHQIWDEYIKHYSMSIISLRRFIWSFTRLGDLTSAHKALQHMVSTSTTSTGGHISLARTGGGKLYSTRLDIPIPSNRELCSKLLDLEEKKRSDSCMHPPFADFADAISANIEPQVILMENEAAKNAKTDGLIGQKHSLLVKALRWSFNDVIHACAHGQNYELAKQLMLQMQNIGLQPSSHTYDGFVRAVVSQGRFSDGMEMLKEMLQKNLKPYDSTLATLSVSCSKARELDLAEALLNQMSKCPHPNPYNAFLASCDIMNQPERAVRVFAKMKQMKLLPDIRTYELLFSLFGNVNAPYEEGNMLSQVDASRRINAIERDMAKNGLKHSHLSMKNLLRALGEEGIIRELIKYLHVAENLFIYRNPSLGTAIYNTVLHSLVEAKESHKAIEIFKKMKLNGCPPDSETYNLMIDCCSILRCYRSASLLVSVMIREGFYPVTCTYTVLIKILLEDEKFNEALNHLDQVRLDGLELDVLLFNTILEKASHKGRIDIIEFVAECMHREKVQPDPATCSHVFSAYINSGFYNTAIEALQVLSLRMICGGGDIFKKKEFVDEFILAEDLDAELHILKLFEDSEENLAAGLLNLRWCAIAGFPICGSADESRWAKRLELKYKSCYNFV